MTEELNLRQKKSVVDGVKGLDKFEVDNINCLTFVHHARHRFLEDQLIGETGPTLTTNNKTGEQYGKKP